MENHYSLPSQQERGPGGEVPPLEKEFGVEAFSSETEKNNFTNCLSFLQEKGKLQYGSHFKILPKDYEVIYKMLVWAFQLQDKAEKHNISLRKGILLSGPVGCGKTSLMYLLNQFLPQERRHVMKSCRDISYEFHSDGFDVVQNYGRKSFVTKQSNPYPRIYCFDDLGTETVIKHYGNQCNAMAEILLSRYDLFISHHMLSHITTNLTGSEIEQLYGIRVRSRMREMFNLVSFSGNCEDKRA